MSNLDVVTIAPGTLEHPRNDSASIVELKDGSLYLSWMEFVKSELMAHDEAPNHIASMVSRDGGFTWGDHRIDVEPLEGAINVYDPSLLRLDNGEIIYAYFHYTKLQWETPFKSVGYLVRSSDEAKTFGEETVIWEEQSIHSANNTFIQLKSGRIIRAIGMTDVWGGPKDNHRVSCMYSDDRGHSWTISPSFVYLPLRGCAEAHIAEAQDGRLVMAMRNQLGSVFVSESFDQGESWSQAQTSGLISPESMPVLVTIPTTGDLLMIWNHSPYMYHPKFSHFGRRTPLSSAISRDCGKTWENIKDIETDPTYGFSNPACNFFGGNKAIVTYYASKMVDPDPPGILGRDALSLKAAICDIDWFYE